MRVFYAGSERFKAGDTVLWRKAGDESPPKRATVVQVYPESGRIRVHEDGFYWSYLTSAQMLTPAISEQ